MISNYDRELWFAEFSSGSCANPLFLNGLGPKTMISSVISVAAAANCPAIADDKLNIRMRSGSNPICSNNLRAYSTRLRAFKLPSR
jgi:hypothetical protein